MIRAKKAPKPTYLQAAWLRRIAQSSMMKTYNENREPFFVISTTGERIPTVIAVTLIHNGWVKGQRDGMFDDPQSYVVLKPDSGISRDNRG